MLSKEDLELLEKFDDPRVKTKLAMEMVRKNRNSSGFPWWTLIPIVLATLIALSL